MIEDLRTHLPDNGSCVASRNLGEPLRALLEYFADTQTVREEVRPAHDCPLLLVQGSRNDTKDVPENGWHLVWEGHRPGDRNERLRLYERHATALPKPAGRG
jgi:hypothetical protein